MKRIKIAAALVPVALLMGSVVPEAGAQQPRAAATRPAGSDVSSQMSLPGPDGKDVLTVTKMAPAQVRLGQDFTYKVMVKNVSASPIQGVTVIEEHSGLQVEKASVEGMKGADGKNKENQPQQDGEMIRLNIGNLAAGESRTLNVTASAAQKGNANSCLRVEYNPTLCTSFAVVEPDFKLVATLLMDRNLMLQQDKKVNGVYRCDKLLLDVKVTSTGDAATAPTTLSVDLPAGVMTTDGKDKMTMELGQLAPGKMIEKQVPLALDLQNAGDMVNITARATAGDLNARAKLPGVKVLDPQMAVMIEGGGTQYIGRASTMKVIVKNTGSDPVLDARVTLSGAKGNERFNVQGMQPGAGGVYALGRLNAGDSKTLTFGVDSATPMKMDVMARAEGYCVEAITEKQPVVIEGIAAILLEVIDQKDPVPVGENTIYEIQVKNQGSAVDNNVQLSATLPGSESFVEGRGETDIKADGAKVMFGKLKSLAPGEVASWYVTIKANKADKAKFKVELTSDANKEAVVEQEPTTLY